MMVPAETKGPFVSDVLPEARPAAPRLPAALGLTLLAVSVAAWWLRSFAQSQPREFIDLDYYRAATAVAVAGQQLFAALPYPPIALLAIAPLGGLPVVVGNEVWSAVSIAVGLGLAYLVTQRGLAARGIAMGRGQLGLFGLTATALVRDPPDPGGQAGALHERPQPRLPAQPLDRVANPSKT